MQHCQQLYPMGSITIPKSQVRRREERLGEITCSRTRHWEVEEPGCASRKLHCQAHAPSRHPCGILWVVFPGGIDEACCGLDAGKGGKSMP